MLQKITRISSLVWIPAMAAILLSTGESVAQQKLKSKTPIAIAKKVNSTPEKKATKTSEALQKEGQNLFSKNTLSKNPSLIDEFARISKPAQVTTPKGGNQSGNHILSADTLLAYTFPTDVWPASLQRIRRHNQTPATPVNYVNQAWVVNTFPGYNGNLVARSTSWFSGANPSPADEWMITPPITIDTNLYELLWKARAVDPEYPDGYEVRLCENCPNLTTQNVLTTMSTVLFSIPQEVTGPAGAFQFTSRKVSLEPYKNKTVRIAFRNNSNDQFLLDIDDIFVLKVAGLDVGLESIAGPAYPCGLSTNENVTVSFKNNGQLPANDITVNLTVNGTPAGSITVPSLTTGATGSVTFSNINLGTPGSYTLAATLVLAGDEVAGNNTISTSYETVAPVNLSSSVFTTSFEPSENLRLWQIENKNNDIFTWFRFVQPNTGNSGDGYFAYPGNGTQADPFPTLPANDYLIGGCFIMEADSSYQLTFYHNSTGSVLHNLAVKYGKAPTADSLTNTIVSYTAIPSNVIYTERNAFFSPTQLGIYFIGFHITSPGGAGRLRLDDVKIRKAPKFDLKIDAITKPVEGGYLCGGNPEPISFRASNTGALTITNAPVRVRVTGGGVPQILNFTIPSLAPGASGEFTVTPGANFSFPAEYTVSVIANLPTDEDASNDSLSVTVEVFAGESAPIALDFEDFDNFEVPDNWFGDEWFTFSNHGVDNSVGIVTNLYANDPQFGSVERAELITPRIDNITANTALAFEYRYMNFMGYPGSAYELQPGDSLKVQVAVNCGNFTTIGSVSAANHSTQTSFVRLLYPLTAYAGSTISVRLLAIHGGGNGDYYIDVDNFQIREIPQFDVAIKRGNLPTYTVSPVKHIQPFRPGFEIRNEGIEDLSALSLSASINPGSYTANTTIGGLESSSSAQVNFSQLFTPTGVGIYNVNYNVETSANQPDGNSANNSLTVNFEVSDSTMARDFGDSEPFGLGIGEGTRGILGQTFQLFVPDTVTSITFWTDELPFGETTVKPVIYTANQSNVPLLLRDTSYAAVTLTTDNELAWNTINLRKPGADAKGKALPAGRFFFGLMEKNQYMSLGYNTNVTTPRTAFFRLGFGTGTQWRAIADVINDGQVFIRPNFRPVVQTNNSQFETSLRMMEIYPNPASSKINLDIRVHAGAQAKVKISDVLGRKIGESVLNLHRGANSNELNIEALQPGLYFMTVEINGSKVTHKFLKQ